MDEDRQPNTGIPTRLVPAGSAVHRRVREQAASQHFHGVSDESNRLVELRPRRVRGQVEHSLDLH